jgi:Tfp pilus assembly protein PilV
MASHITTAAPPSSRSADPGRSTQLCRGSSLVEVLVALLVLTLGLAALIRAQSWLWLASDLTRQRAEATRLTQDDLEQLRAYDHIDVSAAAGATGLAWAAIGAQAPLELTGTNRNAVFRLERSVTELPALKLKAVRSSVRWADRQGQAQQLSLATLIASIDPALVGALTLAPHSSASTGQLAPQGRDGRIPRAARDLGDGRSAFKPRADLSLTWVFDNLTGQVKQRCDSTAGIDNPQLSAASLGNCRAISGQLIAGQVRFATDTATPGVADAENPHSLALDLDMRLSLTSTGHPNPPWECVDDAPSSPSARTVVRYHCVVSINPAATRPSWSGRLDIVPVGWTLAASGSANRRVCRYSSDVNHNGRIDNAEHPAAYADVAEPLGEQNFLVIQADGSCPTDNAVLIGSGTPNLADDSTVAHQP